MPDVTISVDELIKLLKKDNKYADYTIFEKPIKLDELLYYRDISFVDVISVSVSEVPNKELLYGFCGIFEWKDNKISMPDEERFNREMKVYGYKSDPNALDCISNMDSVDCKCYCYGNGWDSISLLVGNDWLISKQEP